MATFSQDGFIHTQSESTPPGLAQTLQNMPSRIAPSITASRTLDNNSNQTTQNASVSNGWLHSSEAYAVSWWLIIFSVLSLSWMLVALLSGALDWRLNYRRREDRPPRYDRNRSTHTTRGTRSTHSSRTTRTTHPRDTTNWNGRRIYVAHDSTLLPRYSDSSDEHASMDWREAVEMMQLNPWTDHEGRPLAPVVRPGEVVIQEANGRTWRRTEEAWIREMELERRMRGAGMM